MYGQDMAYSCYSGRSYIDSLDKPRIAGFLFIRPKKAHQCFSDWLHTH